MRGLVLSILSVSCVYVGIAWIFGRIDINVRSPIVAKYSSKHFFDYAGTLNVHSEKSTGTGGWSEIAAQAKAAGLDFIVLTDSNDFTPPLQKQGYIDDVLIIVGGEYGFVDYSLLNFGFENTNHLKGRGRSEVVFNEILSTKKSSPSEGVFVLAHPFKPGYQRPDPFPLGLDGIEIYNLKSIWQNAWLNKRSTFLWALFLYPISVEWAFTRIFVTYQRPEFGYWDQVARHQKVLGYAGADADARAKMPWGRPLAIPSYQTSFSILKNHVLLRSELTGSGDQDRGKILQALKSGSFYMSFDLIGDPTGFECYVLTKEGRIISMGESVSSSLGAKLVVELPEKPLKDFEVIVTKDGQTLLTSTSLKTEVDISTPGTYRASVRVRLQFPFEGRRWVDWITTNPFWIQQSRSLERSR
jgi:hypothetical protein